MQVTTLTPHPALYLNPCLCCSELYLNPCLCCSELYLNPCLYCRELNLNPCLYCRELSTRLWASGWQVGRGLGEGAGRQQYVVCSISVCMNVV